MTDEGGIVTNGDQNVSVRCPTNELFELNFFMMSDKPHINAEREGLTGPRWFIERKNMSVSECSFHIVSACRIALACQDRRTMVQHITKQQYNITCR